MSGFRRSSHIHSIPYYMILTYLCLCTSCIRSYVLASYYDVYQMTVKQQDTVYGESFDAWNFHSHPPFAVKLSWRNKYRGTHLKLAAFPMLSIHKDCYIHACTNHCDQLADHAIMNSLLLIHVDCKVLKFHVYCENMGAICDLTLGKWTKLHIR